MNILVCVKQVPDDFVKVGLNAEGVPAVEGIEKVVNAFDTYAVEMAVRFCEAHGGKVTVVSIGEEGTVRPSLVQMIAVGAKQAYILKPAAGNGDEGVTASSLADAVKQCEKAEGEPFDLILCGKESTDEISSQVGAMLAEKMGLGFVSSVIGIEPAAAGAEDGTIEVKQETEDGFARYEMKVPAVLTVAKPDYDPRYPTLKSKMAARKAQIPSMEPQDETAKPCVACVAYAEPPKREAGVKIQEKEAAEAVAKAMAMMIQDKVL